MGFFVILYTLLSLTFIADAHPVEMQSKYKPAYFLLI
jgi:hypothetical protein